MSRRFASILCRVIAVFCSTACGAQDLDPRLYANVPTGLNFFVPAFARSAGNVLFDPSIPLENAAVETNGLLLAYARALAFGDKSAQVAVATGNVCLDGAADFQGERLTRDTCGWTDTKIRVAYNFIGAPALDLREFATYRQDLIVGTSIQISAPTGDYDPARLANIGTNRWAVKTELGLSKAVARFLLELSIAGSFFESNDDFYGGRTRAQDPIYSLQGHVIHSFQGGSWIAFDITYYRGGRTATQGIPDMNLQSNTRAGLTLALPINRRQSLRFAASTGTSTRTGTDFDVFAAGWQYRWGAGL